MDKEKRAEFIRKVVTDLNTGKLTDDEKIGLWERIERSTEAHSPVVRLVNRRWARLAVAASVIALATTSMLWWTKSKEQYPRIAQVALHNQYMLADTGAIHLTGANQQAVMMEEDEVIDLATVASGRSANSPDQFNTLTVPYGKRTEVILPDGSRIWLNAGSQLTFPEQFAFDKREVYLEGEGYFDVAHESSRPFVVHVADMQVNVLGTTFNVSSYSEDAFVSAVLLSGKIELQGVGHNKFETQVLEPGNTAVLSKEKRQLTIHQDNASDHISWTQRQLVLKNTPLEELLVKLERVYNAKIEDETEILSGETFSGRLDLRQPLLSVLANIYDPHRYEIAKSERRVTIQEKN